MKRRIVLSLALLAGLWLIASANTAQAFNLFGRGYGCAEPSCCAPEPSCGCSGGHGHCGLFGGLFHRHRGCGCDTGCDSGCNAGCAEPACAAPVEAACCAPEPTCCAPARRHCGLFGWWNRHRGCNSGCNGGCDSGCTSGCAEPACAAPVAAACCAPEPTCCAPARRHCGLFGGLFHHHRGCGYDSGCDVGCAAEPTCCGM